MESLTRLSAHPSGTALIYSRNGFNFVRKSSPRFDPKLIIREEERRRQIQNIRFESSVDRFPSNTDCVSIRRTANSLPSSLRTRIGFESQKPVVISSVLAFDSNLLTNWSNCDPDKWWPNRFKSRDRPVCDQPTPGMIATSLSLIGCNHCSSPSVFNTRFEPSFNWMIWMTSRSILW